MRWKRLVGDEPIPRQVVQVQALDRDRRKLSPPSRPLLAQVCSRGRSDRADHPNLEETARHALAHGPGPAAPGSAGCSNNGSHHAGLELSGTPCQRRSPAARRPAARRGPTTRRRLFLSGGVISPTPWRMEHAEQVCMPSSADTAQSAAEDAVPQVAHCGSSAAGRVAGRSSQTRVSSVNCTAATASAGDRRSPCPSAKINIAPAPSCSGIGSNTKGYS